MSFVFTAAHCGSGLARESGVSVDGDVGAPASSRASSLPQGILGVHESCVHCRPIVGASLLAKRPAHQHHRQLTHRFREQARSHIRGNAITLSQVGYQAASRRRCKSGTASGRYRKNGYTPDKSTTAGIPVKLSPPPTPESPPNATPPSQASPSLAPAVGAGPPARCRARSG